jgi:hypothetical protein
MKTRWYVLIGSVLILIVMAVANMAHAAELYSSGGQSTVMSWGENSSSYYWYEPANTTGTFNSGQSVVTLAATATWYRMRTASYTCPLYQAIRLTNFDVYGSTDLPVPDEQGYCDWHIDVGATAGGIPAGANIMAIQADAYHLGQSVFGSVSNSGKSFYTSQTLLGTGGPYWALFSGEPTGPTNDTSRIISVIPSGGATTSPVALSMQYYSSGTSTTPLDTVSLDLRSVEGGGASVLSLSSAAATGTITTWSASSSATLPDGLYTAFWSLSSSESILFHIGTSTQFIVGTSTWQELISLASTTPSATCSIVDIGGCMQSVITWAFIPSEVSQNLLAQSGTALLHAPPLGYYYTYHDTIEIAFSTTTIDEVMATSTRAALISIIDPMRAGAIAVFWAGWLVAQYAFFMRFILPLV